MKIVLRDLIRDVSKATGLALPDARVVVKRVVSSLEEGLISGDRIEIRGFGVFQTKKISGKKGRNISKNTSMALPDYLKVSFKAGKNIRKLFRDLSDPKLSEVGENEQLKLW